MGAKLVAGRGVMINTACDSNLCPKTWRIDDESRLQEDEMSYASLDENTKY
jgi:hypothetical protein